jgi:hypothetical protein
MGKIAAKIIDKATHESVAARVQVLSAEGRFMHPHDALLKVGPGIPFFYGDGEFVLEAPCGFNQILVECGTEYRPERLRMNVPSNGTIAIDILLERWSDLAERGWHPGNTHIHYDQHETRPDERLRLDPRVEDIRVTAISILKRWDRPYAVNKYSPGVLTEFCSAHHYVECGEESRHNDREDQLDEGYGHIMLLRIKETVEPVSRGYLVDELDPDYPPLCYACDGAHRQGGVVIWCHNGRGMEAPVAAALGKLDAFNLFDPFWVDPEYKIWYEMLNCGLRLPASTGSDWFISSGNRVYVHTGNVFRYDDWIAGLQAGRTMITNGPALFLNVDDAVPGGVLRRDPGMELDVFVSWVSHYALDRVEVVWNGKAVAGREYPEGSNRGQFSTRVAASSDGWLAARVFSRNFDSFYQPIYAHTSPVYVLTGVRSPEQREAAGRFATAIDSALEKINRRFMFPSQTERLEVVELFRAAQDVYKGMLDL